MHRANIGLTITQPGLTYATCKTNEVHQHMLDLLPLSLAEPMSLQLEQGIASNGIQVTYTPVLYTETMLLSPSQRLRPTIEDIWIRLWNRLSLAKCQKKCRFSHRVFKDRMMLAVESSLLAQTVSVPSSPTTPSEMSDASFLLLGLNSGVFGKTIKSHKIGSQSETTIDDDVSLPFAEKDSYGCNSLQHILSMNMRELSVHILKFHADESSELIHETARQFVSAQLWSSRLLCSLLLDCSKAFMKQNATVIGGPDLSPYSFMSRISSNLLGYVFRIMEKYQIACLSIASPVPQGFLLFFSVLGFECLSFPIFMQYMNKGGLQLLPETVEYIMNDEREGSAEIKLEILMHLPRSKVWKYLEAWDHPLSFAIQVREHRKLMYSLPSDDKKEFQFSHSLTFPEKFAADVVGENVSSEDQQHETTEPFPSCSWKDSACCPSSASRQLTKSDSKHERINGSTEMSV